jgi:hypothetical protein
LFKSKVSWITLALSLVSILSASIFQAHAFFCPDYKQIQITLKSPGELRVIDSRGQVTGLINGTAVSEIPASDYFNNSITIFVPIDSYFYEVVGTAEGLYDLEVTAVTREGNITFAAIGIPTSTNVVHLYTIDWPALFRSEEGVTVQVDLDGDNVFERSLAADLELTSDEFMLTTKTIDLNKDGTVNILDISIVAIAFGTKEGEDYYNVLADLDKNNEVNILDVSIVAMDYGKTV